LLSGGICVASVTAVVCPANCQNCSRNGNCVQCNIGFYLDQTGTQCNACGSGCSRCLSNTMCMLCQPNYDLQGDGTCMAVATNANCTLVVQAISLTITQIALAAFQTATFALIKTLALLATRISISAVTTQLALNL
jgi:hypothetical protein